MIDFSQYKITIENLKGSYKSFAPEDDPYPLKGVTYPVDYGCVADYLGEDGDELDIFVGSGNKNGFIKVWRPDVPEETKFFINLTTEELENIVRVFEPVLLKHQALDDKDFITEIEKFKN